jgi:translation initiation factor 2 beta subunit (eIF-2beta)/eIF-5
MWSIEDIMQEVGDTEENKSEGRSLDYDLKFKSSKHGMIIKKITGIAAKFDRPVSSLVSFLKTKLSSVVKHDAVADQLLLSTKTSSILIRSIFTKYIAEFITCSVCKKHDTTLSNSVLVCTGCGAQRITKIQK